MVQAVREVSRIVGTTTFLDLYVKLARIPGKANPAFEAIARMRIHEDLREAGGDTTLIDLAYGATNLGCMTEEEAAQVEEVPVIDTVTIHGRLLHLTNNQQEALVLGNSRYPLIALQAAFGPGKTVVGASIAIYQAQQGQRVIVTASTETAIAQFTNTLLGFAQANDVGVVRFVAETIAFDTDVPSTQVDLNEVLKRISTVYAPVLSRSERETCRRFAEGRILPAFAVHECPDGFFTREKCYLDQPSGDNLIRGIKKYCNDTSKSEGKSPKLTYHAKKLSLRERLDHIYSSWNGRWVDGTWGLEMDFNGQNWFAIGRDLAENAQRTYKRMEICTVR
ncbi:unnamed protein product [Cylicocyclus nassatus]|uniref:Uncharacterized protein n=1 Tax=Cylicocyclus nassatus TaxID=53992 RepID=A0AA36DLJ1_CYLNA|nr:unnamed protein product [Cylicocyclus nassatus]